MAMRPPTRRRGHAAALPRRLLAWLSALLVLTCLPDGGWAEGASPEYGVKAAFLLNFAQFIEWPAETFADANAPLRVGVLGDDPFGPVLEDTLHGATVRTRPLVVLRAADPQQLAGCHLLFISRSERPRLAPILAALADRPTLTVSDLDGFTAQGGGIRLYLAGRKVRFEIDPATLQAHHLKASPQLLALARPAEGR